MSFLGEGLAIESGEFSGENGIGSWNQGGDAIPKVSDRRRRRLRIHRSGKRSRFDSEDVER